MMRHLLWAVLTVVFAVGLTVSVGLFAAVRPNTGGVPPAARRGDDPLPLPLPGGGQVQPPSAAPGGKAVEAKPPEVGWEVRTPDGQFQKVTPLDVELTLETKYGTMKLPMKEVKRVEFGLRPTEAQRTKLADALTNVIGGSGRTREAGKEVLLELGLVAYPAVVRAMKTAPKEALPHLTMVLDKVKPLLGKDDDPPTDVDVVYAADGSRLAGALTPDAVRVKVGETEKAIRWADARVLAFGDLLVDEKVEVVTIAQFGIHGLMQTHFEKVVGVEVTGAVGGSVWGSNPYTTDSTLGSAAVHSGVLKVGETGVIKIKVKADLGGYVGSTQNGVTTGNWGPYQGCYEIVSKGKKKGK